MSTILILIQIEFYPSHPGMSATRSFVLAATALAGLMALPLLMLGVLALVPGVLPFSGAGGASVGAWTHLAATVLTGYVRDSLLLMAGVATGTLAMGVGAAWLVARHEFPFKGVLQWALVLPLAMPGYVVAYAAVDFFQFSGPAQTGLRALLGVDGLAWKARGYWFPEIRSVGGAALLFTVVLYPYVYLPVRAAFLARGASLMEAAQLLGARGVMAWWRVAIPLARPAMAAGVVLALMETLADYGVASYFSIDTFTVGIYKTWFGLGDKPATAQLALVLLSFMLLLMWGERVARGRARFAPGGTARNAQLVRLSGLSAWIATVLCAVPVLLGFVAPLVLLLRLLWMDFAAAQAVQLGALAWNTVRVSALAALVTVAVALVLAYAVRLAAPGRDPQPGLLARGAQAAARVGASGYAMPGAVLAVGLLVTLGLADRVMGSVWVTGSLAGLVAAYTVRLTAVALNNLEAGLSRITPAMDDAAQSLGYGPVARLMAVHVPLLKPSLALALLLVFIDALKELPATLILRPFNFDTLATAAHNLAKDERLAEAALPSLMIVAISLIPVIWIARRPGPSAS
jgi:iron(III) transport system permease protein